MKPVFKFGYYVGTFGGTIEAHLECNEGANRVRVAVTRGFRRHRADGELPSLRDEA